MIYLDYAESTLKELDAYWTAKEIQQQPQMWLETFAMLSQNESQISSFMAPILAQPGIRIIFTGAGTSAFVGESITPAVSAALGCRVEAIATTDLVSNPHEYFQAKVPTLLVSFARSGNSPESKAALEYADSLIENCYQLAITCNEDGHLYKSCQGTNKFALLMPEGTNDISFAMTSSFSCMLLSAIYVFGDKTHFETQLQQTVKATSELMKTHSMLLKGIAKQQFERVVYLGSGCFKGLARESALKLLELTDGKVVSCFDSPLGFRHGPKAIVNAKTLVVVYVSNDPHTRQYDLELVNELTNDSEVGKLVVVSAQNDNALTANDTILIETLSEQSDTFLMLPYIVCAQIYALQHALSLGNTPDNPSASGTINRVVQGVNIHAI